MKEKLYNLKKQILKEKNISDWLKEELTEQIFQIEQELAITVTPCCTELKDKEALTFNQWLKLNIWKQIGVSYTFRSGEIYTDAESLLSKYVKEYNSL